MYPQKTLDRDMNGIQRKGVTLMEMIGGKSDTPPNIWLSRKDAVSALAPLSRQPGKGVVEFHYLIFQDYHFD